MGTIFLWLLCLGAPRHDLMETPANIEEAVSDGSCEGNATLEGSQESLKRQNAQADEEGLVRIKDDKELAKLKKDKFLIPLPKNEYLRTDWRIPKGLRYCTKWTNTFLLDISQEHWNVFGTRLQINSATRTVLYQKRLRKRNANAAEAEGDTASSHLTGATVDIAKLKMTKVELEWMRAYLLELEKCGLIEATEEFNQAVFHVMVFRHYGWWKGNDLRTIGGLFMSRNRIYIV